MVFWTSNTETQPCSGCILQVSVYVSRLTSFPPLSSSPLNQLGKVNELIIKPDLSESTEGKEDKDVVEEAVDGESGSKADSVFTATSFESALNLVITKTTSYK